MSEPLYAIVAKYQADLLALQDLDLPPEVVLDTVESMQGAIEEKVRAVVAYAIEMEKAAGVRAAEAARMKESAERMASRADSLKTYAQIALMNSGLKLPLIAPEFTLNIIKNPRIVEILDPKALPSEAVKTTIEVSFDGRCGDVTRSAILGAIPDGASIDIQEKPIKKVIGDTLKADKPVPGARLEPQSFRLSIR